MGKTKQVQLLSDTEVEDLYARPEFSTNEQALYFALNKTEQTALDRYSNTKTRVYFILQLGYLKAKQKFYDFVFDDVLDDTQFILKSYYGETELMLSGRVSRDYRNEQKQDILTLFNYSGWSPKYAPTVERHIGELLKFYPKGHSALRQLLGYFENQEIVIPSYRTLQDLFASAYTIENERMSSIILSIPENVQHQLSALIYRRDGMSQLNIVRADQKDFQFTAVRAEVDKVLRISDLYTFSREFIPTLKISKNAIRYYSDIAEQYTASRLRRLNKPIQWLHAICFVYHRYQQLIDNLIISFMYHTRAIMNAGKTYAEMAMLEHSSRVVVESPKLAQFLKWFPSRSELLNHNEMNQIAYDILPEEQFPALAEFLDGNIFDKKAAKWEYYLKSTRMFSLYLRPIFLAVTFEFYKENSHVMELIDILKTHYASGKGPSMLILSDDLGLTIPKSMAKYLKRNPTDEHIDPYLFEFYVYQKIYHQLDRGKLFCNDSVSYCDIDNDLIDDSLVDDAENIAFEFGYPKIPIYCDQRLDEAIEMLNAAWDRTTENIRTNSNPGFKLKETKAGPQWSLLYDSVEKLDDTFFKTLPKIEIADVLMFIGDRIDIWGEFAHIKDRYIKRQKPEKLAVNACVISEAFGFSTGKMADMSDLSVNILQSTREDFIRVETLCAANDLISNDIHSLSIFKQWNLIEDKVLADADGQKFSTSDSTIQSRYSKKYLGKGRGISLYSLIANFVPVNAKNIGLNEYEGHSLYDVIYGNNSNVDINMVTGDNHSLNKLNFVALDSIDVDYVPSIKNVREAANELYSIKSPDSYAGVLRPSGTIIIDRIRSQKRGILRVLLSLIMQENTQTNIIRKLNSHARYARLKAGLFEYNKIFKSTHVLNLIDDMQLRKALRAARNRTEAYHSLQSTIRRTYNGVFRGKRIVDNRIGAHAVRLIANSIIAYNSIILNTVLEKMVSEGVAQEIIDEFTRISPIAWAHLLFTGRYNFLKVKGAIDVENMAQILEKHLKQHFWVAN
ncbi:MAG: Tn3 family transposase [Pseudomonadales bacterium]|nr:Tn3 family transposase [Pseudomonadales bacterium]